MRKFLGRAIAGCLVLLCAVSVYATGQQHADTPKAAAQAAAKAAKPRGISPTDQRAIQALFKGVDETKYRLQFDGGKRVVGKREVGMQDLEQVKKVRNPGEAAGWIVLIVEGNDVIYILAVGNSELESVLGKEKTMKLNQIMAKYATHS